GREFNVTQRSVDNAVFISAVANLTGFGVLDRSLNVCSYSANLRVRHQATGTKDLAQLTDHTHGIRSGNNHVEVHVAFLHFVSQIIHTHHVCTGSSGFFGIGTLGEHSYTNSLASTVRQNSAATYDLVRFTCINAQVYGYVYRLFELDVLAQLGQQCYRLINGVGTGRVYFFTNQLLTLAQLCHLTDPPRSGPFCGQFRQWYEPLRPYRQQSDPALWSWQFLPAEHGLPYPLCPCSDDRNRS